MRKVYNFNAGPAMLPEEVLLQAQSEMLDWHRTGMSIMELSHRGEDFQRVIEQTEVDLRELMAIPNNYKVLFVAGGASTQFAMVPLNLLDHKKTADYVDTGVWSHKAVAEAKRYGNVNIAAKTMYENDIAYIPSQDQWHVSKDAAYLHYTANETIEGIEFHYTPNTKDIPLVADMTSMILSRPINVASYGIIYAGAQKNIGPAGLNIVIIREDLINEVMPLTPTLYQYKIYAENKSVYNTPPTYCCYIAGLVFAWMKRHGGVDAFYKVNQRKANKLYDCIDQHKGFYISKVANNCRSFMNVMFYLPDENLTPVFLKEAAEIGLRNLRGHRISGGIRASIYNAMPEEGVDTLVSFMTDFVKRKG